MLDKQHKVPNHVSNLHLCEVLAWNFKLIPIYFVKVVINYQKGEIESPMFGFDNLDN